MPSQQSDALTSRQLQQMGSSVVCLIWPSHQSDLLLFWQRFWQRQLFWQSNKMGEVHLLLMPKGLMVNHMLNTPGRARFLLTMAVSMAIRSSKRRRHSFRRRRLLPVHAFLHHLPQTQSTSKCGSVWQNKVPRRMLRWGLVLSSAFRVSTMQSMKILSMEAASSFAQVLLTSRNSIALPDVQHWRVPCKA